MAKTGPVTAEIFLIWTNIARINVARINVAVTVENLFYIFPGINFQSFVKIESVTAEIFLIWTNVAGTNVA